MANKGIIIKSVGGLYTVESSDGIYECRARGVFRSKGISPCVGDRAEFSDGVITSLEQRKNCIVRPPLANLDQLIFVVSMAEPSPNLLLLDKFIAVAEHQGIEPVIAVTKIDLEDCKRIAETYLSVGIRVCIVDYESEDPPAEMREILKDKISAFTGNSGAGKSTLLNCICSEFNIPTGEISRKLGRGRHTTRHAELYKLPFGGWIADTPGFSTFETSRYGVIKKEELSGCFREFGQYEGECRFRDCSHTKEKDCRVIRAVNEGAVAASRHNSYCEMYEEAKLIKEWEL